jgi:plasmid maintenance system antidote protein VapI
VNPQPGPGLEKLLHRLVRRLTALLTNGEFTERGLARLCGISQPHLHHILAGKRSLTPHVADAILASLGWGIETLISEEELDAILMARRQRGRASHRIPVISGRIGPSCPFPDTLNAEEWLLARSPFCEGLRRLFLAELAPDPAVPFARNSAVFALITEDEEIRLRLAPDAWFVLRWGGAGLVRRVREERGTLVLLGQEVLEEPGRMPSIPFAGQSLLSVVRGRLLWAGPDPRQFDPFAHSGSGFPIATAS